MMYKIKSIEEFINESISNSLWRNTSYKWLLDFLKKGKLNAGNRFISFSLSEDSGGQDNFGGTRIEFDVNLLYKQGAIEIYYEPDFFEQYPDISQYVTGFRSAEEYYENKDYSGPEDANANFDLTWEQYIEDYEVEQEVVIKKLKYVDGLIKHVNFINDKPNKQLISLLNKLNISYS